MGFTEGTWASAGGFAVGSTPASATEVISRTGKVYASSLFTASSMTSTTAAHTIDTGVAISGFLVSVRDSAGTTLSATATISTASATSLVVTLPAASTEASINYQVWA